MEPCSSISIPAGYAADHCTLLSRGLCLFVGWHLQFTGAVLCAPADTDSSRSLEPGSGRGSLGCGWSRCLRGDLQHGQADAKPLSAALQVCAPVAACALSTDGRCLWAAVGNGFILRYEYTKPLADQVPRGQLPSHVCVASRWRLIIRLECTVCALTV